MITSGNQYTITYNMNFSSVKVQQSILYSVQHTYQGPILTFFEIFVFCKIVKRDTNSFYSAHGIRDPNIKMYNEKNINLDNLERSIEYTFALFLKGLTPEN